MKEEDLRAGVVGLGKMGLLHASTLSALPHVQLVAVCDKSRLIRRFAKKLLKRVKVVESVNDFSSLGLDVVYVTTPIPFHYSVVRTAYKNKVARDLFVEKSLASNYGEAVEMCKLADNAGGVNMVGYMRRYSVTFRRAKEVLDQETLGELSSFSAYSYSSDFPFDKADAQTRALRGGIFRDLGCHAVDLALWFFGGLKVDFEEAAHSDEESVAFSVEGDRIEGRFEVAWNRHDYRMAETGMTINGSKGAIKVNDDILELDLRSGERQVWYRHDLADSVPFSLGGPEYFRENQHFVNAVFERTAAEPDFRTASEVDKIIDHAERRFLENEQKKQ